MYGRAQKSTLSCRTKTDFAKLNVMWRLCLQTHLIKLSCSLQSNLLSKSMSTVLTKTQKRIVVVFPPKYRTVNELNTERTTRQFINLGQICIVFS